MKLTLFEIKRTSLSGTFSSCADAGYIC